ncbi:MAG TPA: ChbG/HpnK family deacetylase [Candidatus Acidoferrales bacterium]|nr:ChbG/HpnK family deacetylase [Candidatus Acidoferrales bacterium]
MKEKRLIVNADDFGMSRGISDGILLAHRFGILTSASLMVNMPGSDYAVQCLPSAPALSLGIHLNICQGKPISPAADVPSLVGTNGYFHPPLVMIRKLWRWQVSVRELETEFRAQIRWVKSRGLHPTHADSHHHMHIYPAAVASFAHSVAAEGILSVRASRFSCWPKSGLPGGPHEGGIVRRVLVQSYRSALQHSVLQKFSSAESRISFPSAARRDTANLGALWATAFENLPAGTFELACHPGFFERGFSEFDPIHRQREDELGWLTNPKMRAVIERCDIHLISYSQLLANHTAPRTQDNHSVESVA